MSLQLMQWTAEAKGSQLTDAEDELDELEAELKKEKESIKKVRIFVGVRLRQWISPIVSASHPEAFMHLTLQLRQQAKEAQQKFQQQLDEALGETECVRSHADLTGC